MAMVVEVEVELDLYLWVAEHEFQSRIPQILEKTNFGVMKPLGAMVAF